MTNNETAREQLEKHLIDVIHDCEKWYKDATKSGSGESNIIFVRDMYIPIISTIADAIMRIEP